MQDSLESREVDVGLQLTRRRTIKGRLTAEDLLYTKEERNERLRRKALLSGVSLQNLWSHYKQVILHPGEFGDRELACTPQQQRLLQQRYAYLKAGINRLCQAPAYPFVRLQRNETVHSPGRRHTRPEVVRNVYPVRGVELPSALTVSYTHQETSVENVNFWTSDLEAVEKHTTDRETQYGPDLSLSPASNLRQATRPEDQLERHPEIDFDYWDYPVDADGNPIGKTTGFCEWCDKPILPIPTPDILAVRENKAGLYCCPRYRAFIEEAVELERRLRAEIDAANFLIDIRPRARARRSQKSEDSDSMSGEVTAVKSLKTKPGESQSKAKLREQQFKKKQKEKLHAQRMEKEEKEKREHQEQMEQKNVDTFDLPWDPYETLFGHPPFFSDDAEIDDPLARCYPHVDVILTQSELLERFKPPSSKSSRPDSHEKKEHWQKSGGKQSRQEDLDSCGSGEKE